jgi:hypothetical protein
MPLTRLPIVSLAAILLLTIGGVAGPPASRVSDADKDATFIPAVVGDKLIYERTIQGKAGESKETVTELVTAVERKDGLMVAVEYRYGAETKPRRTMRFRATDAGVYLVEYNGRTFAPERLVKLPVRAGDAWESSFAGRTDASFSSTTAKEEEVEVPAGKFRAVRIESVFKGKGFTLKTTDWYARGVGLVKSTSIADYGENEVKVLKSFTPGKK